MLELNHKKQIAWQKAIQLLPLIYEACRKLPKQETFNIVSQLKRAALSVSNNLAESASGKTRADKKRFFEISRSSVVEIDNCLIATLVLNQLKKEDTKEVEAALLELFKLPTGLTDANRE